MAPSVSKQLASFTRAKRAGHMGPDGIQQQTQKKKKLVHKINKFYIREFKSIKTN